MRLTKFLQSSFGNLENKFISEKSGSGYRGYSSTFPETSPTLDWPLHDFLFSEIKSIFCEDIQIKNYGLWILFISRNPLLEITAPTSPSNTTLIYLDGLSLEYSF